MQLPRSEQELANEFASIARSMFVSDHPDRAFRVVAETAVQVIDGSDYCAITVNDRGRPHTRGANGELAVLVDAIQYETGEGPCLEAIRSHHTYEIEDLEAEQRWPEFARRVVAETPVRSALSFRLFLEGRTLGALNLYAARSGSFTTHDHETGTIFAAHAAVALAAADEIATLRTALDTRDVISTAKGMLMARQNVSAEDAFDILRRASRRTNVKLRDLAAQLVNSQVESSVAGIADPDPASPD